jgi:hypothetical protein
MTFHQSFNRHTHQRWLRIVKNTEAQDAAHRIITMKPYKWMWSHLGLTVFQAIVASIHTAISTKTILTHSTHLRIYYLTMMTVAIISSLVSSLIFSPTLHSYWLWQRILQTWQTNFRSLHWVRATWFSIALVSIYTLWIIRTEAKSVEIVWKDKSTVNLQTVLEHFLLSEEQYLWGYSSNQL